MEKALKEVVRDPDSLAAKGHAPGIGLSSESPLRESLYLPVGFSATRGPEGKG